MPGAVFFPEHHQVHPGTLELANQVAPDRLGTPANPARRPVAGKQPLLQNRIRQIGRQRPGQPSDLRTPQIILDRAAGDAQHPPDLTGADPLASQPQRVSYLPHR